MIPERYKPTVATSMSSCAILAVSAMKVATEAMPVPRPPGIMYRDSRVLVCPWGGSQLCFLGRQG